MEVGKHKRWSGAHAKARHLLSFEATLGSPLEMRYVLLGTGPSVISTVDCCCRFWSPVCMDFRNMQVMKLLA